MFNKLSHILLLLSELFSMLIMQDNEVPKLCANTKGRKNVYNWGENMNTFISTDEIIANMFSIALLLNFGWLGCDNEDLR